MKKYGIYVLLLCALACNSNEDQTKTKEAPAATDNTTQHPNGTTSGDVISTDTGAIAGDSTPNKK